MTAGRTPAGHRRAQGARRARAACGTCSCRARTSTAPGSPTCSTRRWPRSPAAAPWIAPEALNCSAPDTGNMELLSLFGTRRAEAALARAAARGRDPLGVLDDRARRGLLGRDEHRDAIERDGDEYVINGRKWWTSGAMSPRCELLIVMGVTDPDAERHRRQSMILVPKDTPGVDIRRSTTRVRLRRRLRTAATPRSSTTTSACRRRTCSARRATASGSPRSASGRAASTTRCARSAWPSGRSR